MYGLFLLLVSSVSFGQETYEFVANATVAHTIVHQALVLQASEPVYGVESPTHFPIQFRDYDGREHILNFWRTPGWKNYKYTTFIPFWLRHVGDYTVGVIPPGTFRDAAGNVNSATYTIRINIVDNELEPVELKVESILLKESN